MMARTNQASKINHAAPDQGRGRGHKVQSRGSEVRGGETPGVKIKSVPDIHRAKNEICARPVG